MGYYYAIAESLDNKVALAIRRHYKPQMNAPREQLTSNLFDYLPKLGKYAIENGLDIIAVAPIPNRAIGLAINDRLSRVAE